MYDESHSPVAKIVATGGADVASPAKARDVRSVQIRQTSRQNEGLGIGVRKRAEGRTRKFSSPRSLLKFLINHLVSAEGGGIQGG